MPPMQIAHCVKPAITSKKCKRKQLQQFAEAGGLDTPETWVRELHTTLTQLSREFNEPSVVRLMALETSFIQKTVQQKKDMRAEKFYEKMKQAGRAAALWQSHRTALLLEDVKELMKTVRPELLLQEYRMPSPALLQHLLLHFMRGHELLQRIIACCEDAGLWLKFKMTLGQRCGLALALFSVVARLRSLCQYYEQCQRSGYEKLLLLLDGVTDSSGAAITEGLPLQLIKEDHTRTGKKPSDVRDFFSSWFGAGNKSNTAISTNGITTTSTSGITTTSTSGITTTSTSSITTSTTSGSGDHQQPAPSDPLPPSSSLMDMDDLGELEERLPAKKEKKKRKKNLLCQSNPACAAGINGGGAAAAAAAAVTADQTMRSGSVTMKRKIVSSASDLFKKKKLKTHTGERVSFLPTGGHDNNEIDDQPACKDNLDILDTESKTSFTKVSFKSNTKSNDRKDIGDENTETKTNVTEIDSVAKPAAAEDSNDEGDIIDRLRALEEKLEAKKRMQKVTLARAMSVKSEFKENKGLHKSGLLKSCSQLHLPQILSTKKSKLKKDKKRLSKSQSDELQEITEL